MEVRVHEKLLETVCIVVTSQYPKLGAGRDSRDPKNHVRFSLSFPEEVLCPVHEFPCGIFLNMLNIDIKYLTEILSINVL